LPERDSEFEEILRGLDKNEVRIIVRLETRKFRKPVTMILGLPNSKSDLEQIARSLKGDSLRVEQQRREQYCYKGITERMHVKNWRDWAIQAHKSRFNENIAQKFFESHTLYRSYFNWFIRSLHNF